MRVTVVAGAIAGCAAALAFLAVHALVIVPIWWSVGHALGEGAVAGAVIGGAFHVIARRPPALGDAVWLGFFMWAALLAPSACIHLVRIARVPEPLEVAVGVAANVVVGAAVAYRVRRTAPAALAGVVAAITVLVTAGPVSRLNVRAVAIYACLLPVDVAFGAVLALGGGLVAHLLPERTPQEV